MCGEYNSVELARYMRALAFQQGLTLNVTQAQKLLYMLYGYSLAKRGRKITDEQPQAWPYGPVFPKTRDDFKLSLEIIKDMSKIDPSFRNDKDLTEDIKTILKKYGNTSALQLTKWSHKKDSPWDKTRKLSFFLYGEEVYGDEIPDEYIEEYFSQFDTI